MSRISVIAILAVVVIAGCSNQNPASCNTEKKQLSFGAGNDEGSALLRAADGTIYAAWGTDYVNTQVSGNANIVMVKSTDNGETWSQPWTVIDSPYQDFGSFFIQAQDGTFYMPMWRQAPETYQSDIWLITSKDAVTWSEPKAITNDYFDDSGGVLKEDSNGNLWVIWASGRTGNKEVFISESKDKGNTWSSPIQITNHPFHDEFPVFVINDGTFYAAWIRIDPAQKEKEGFLNYLSTETELYYSTSNDGIRWSEPIALTKDTSQKNVDTLPMMYKRADGKFYLSWITTRFNPVGTIEQVPISELPSLSNHVQLKGVGYSMDNIPLDDKRDLMTWTEENKAGDIISRDTFYKIIPSGCAA